MFDAEIDGRVARAEIDLYDGIIAEMGKGARFRKYLRTHELRNDGHPVRKDKRKAYVKEKCYSCDPWIGFETVRNVRIAEKIRTDAEDWEMEEYEIALSEELRKWGERIMAEIEEERKEKERKDEHMRLVEWLKWA